MGHTLIDMSRLLAMDAVIILVGMMWDLAVGIRKAIEGYDCDALYPDWKARRRALRDQINELESEV